MQTLRNAPLLARFVLVWFALFIGVAVASPIVHTQSIDMVCTTSGSMKFVNTDDGSDASSNVAHTLDCPLCIHVLAPSYEWGTSLPSTSPLALVLQPIAAAHIASLTAPPLPSRGPPATSLI
jgi:Protein of unknown function (DUF2946)